MNEHAKGLAITLLGVLCVVPDALFVRLIDATPATIAFWRSLLSGTIIGLGVLAFSGRTGFRAVAGQGRRALIYAAGIGASGVGFVTAVSLTRVANVVFIIAAMPVFAALLSRVFLGEPVTRRVAVTTGVVAAGLAVIALGGGAGGGSGWGELAALGTALAFAAALTAARAARPVAMVPALPLANLGAALVIWPFAQPLSVLPEQWGLVMLHGGIFIVASTALLSLGPRYLPSSEVALLILLESVLAPLLVWAVLGEAPGGWVLVGGGLVIGALAASNGLALARRRG